MDQRGGGGAGLGRRVYARRPTGGLTSSSGGGTATRERDGDDRARRRGGGDVWIGGFLPEDEAVALFRMAQAQIPFPVGSDIELGPHVQTYSS
jgi:hypothetical protein